MDPIAKLIETIKEREDISVHTGVDGFLHLQIETDYDIDYFNITMEHSSEEVDGEVVTEIVEIKDFEFELKDFDKPVHLAMSASKQDELVKFLNENLEL